MSKQQSYRVLQPVHLAGQGTVQAGESVELHPRQAVFLLTSGVIEKAPQTTAPPAKTTRKGTSPRRRDHERDH